MFIWLKDGPETDAWAAEFAARVEHGRGVPVKVEKDGTTGRRCIFVNSSPWSPSARIPAIPAELVEEVTVRDRLLGGFRREGIYRHADAELMAKLDLQNAREGIVEVVDIRAPSVEAAREIYQAFRRGELTPVEIWDTPEKDSMSESVDGDVTLGRNLVIATLRLAGHEPGEIDRILRRMGFAGTIERTPPQGARCADCGTRPATHRASVSDGHDMMEQDLCDVCAEAHE